MYLAKLDIQGFKSFAHKTSLDFQRGITAIVGPNGSGKSNVADAIRWVLGEQSMKMLRGKRSDDVIFAGSDKKSRLGVAEVSLYLNNEDHRVPLDYSEVILTRRVYRDGEGEYLINRQPSRLQDFQMLLARANFGQRTYSVIGQGMIDSFLISSPQERKHLFDEAAGVRHFQLKKDQAVQKLNQAKENLTRGEAIMFEIEPRLRSLTRQVRRLERREEIEQELRQQQTIYFGLRWQEIERDLARLKTEHHDATRRRQDIEHQLQAIQEELEAIERERSASEIFAGLQKQYNTILDEKNSLLQEQAVIKGQLEVAARQAGRAETVFRQQRAQEVKRHLDQIQEELEVIEQLRARTQKTLIQRQAELAVVDKKFNALEERLQATERQWQENFTWPQMQTAATAYFNKYQAFVEELQTPAMTIETARQKAIKLEAELGALVAMLSATTAGGSPQDLLKLQRQVMDLTKERQAVLAQQSVAQTDHQRAEDQWTRLTDDQKKLQAEFKKGEAESSVQELAKSNPEEAYAVYVQQAKKIEQRITDLDERLKKARAAINNFNTSETTKKERLFVLQKEFRNTQHQLNLAGNMVNDLDVQLARLEQRHDDLKREIIQAMWTEAVDHIAQAARGKLEGDPAVLAEDIQHLQHQVNLIGGIDEQTTQEYRATKERYDFLKQQSDDLHGAINSLDKAIDELENTIKKRFDAAFKKINSEFERYFRTLFRGGRAELVLIQEVIKDEFEEDETGVEVAEQKKVVAPADIKKEKVVTGIEIKATPPGKKLQNIAMLSGGERALTSIALLCAIISNNPSPFVTLDEVDAALDEANSQRFAAILEHLAKDTQFITITHNRATMEKAHTLYGVTMGDDGVSQLFSVHMAEAEKIIQAHGNR